MNILSTSKGRVIILMFLVSLFGLRLTASASARIRMVCDTDTTAKKKTNKQVLTSDTTLVIKGGATILRNADTILIINGVPTKISKASPQVKPDPGINMDGGAKADSAAKGFQEAPVSKIKTIYTPTEGTIQVKNNPGDQPTNTTIVAPPTDGVIQVRGGGNQGQVTTVPAPGGKVPAVIPTPGAGAAGNASPGNVSPGQSAASEKGNAGNANPGNANPASGTVTNGEIQVGDQNAAGNAANGGNGKVVEKHDTTTILKHDTTTILKKDTTTILKKDTTTIFQRDTVTIIKKDTVTITKRDTIGGGQTAEQDTTDYSQIKAKSYYLQIGGAGLAISANYDARLNAERNGWGYTVGIGGFSSQGNSVITVPFQINYLIGEHSSMLQVGGGATFLHSTGNNTGKTWSFDRITGFVATGSFGYRYQPEQKGLSFKVEFVPILYDEGIIPAGGISIGYTFK